MDGCGRGRRVRLLKRWLRDRGRGRSWWARPVMEEWKSDSSKVQGVIDRPSARQAIPGLLGRCEGVGKATAGSASAAGREPHAIWGRIGTHDISRQR